MTKLKTPLLSFGAKGRLSKLFSLVRRRGQNIIERKPIPVDAKSPAQLFNRHMFTKCVDLWHLLSEEEKQIWESLARPLHMTGYAWFISQCLRPNPGIYLPLQGGVMSGNIDMAKNRLLKLPEPTDAQEPATKGYVDALSKVIWKDASQTALYDSGRTETLPFTDLSLTASTSPNAKIAILRLDFRATVVGTDTNSRVTIRKKGTAPAHSPSLTMNRDGTTPGVYHYAMALIGLDSAQGIQYEIYVGTAWTLYTGIRVLGYIE